VNLLAATGEEVETTADLSRRSDLPRRNAVKTGAKAETGAEPGKLPKTDGSGGLKRPAATPAREKIDPFPPITRITHPITRKTGSIAL
jgi:hypothetical protein